VDAFGFFRKSQALWRSTRDTGQRHSWAIWPARPPSTRRPTPVDVDQLTLGGSGPHRIRRHQRRQQRDPTGLHLTGVNFALGHCQTEQNPTAPANGPRVDSRQSFSATGASFVGVAGLTVSATAIDIAITRKATDNTLVDYAAQSLAVQTSTTANPSTITLDLAAEPG
jgi:hypothetical protein